MSAMELEAARIPGEADVREHAAAPDFRIVDEVLVPQLEQRLRRQHGTPVRHQATVLTVVMREVAEVSCVGVRGGESLEVNRQARIERIPLEMNEPGTRQRRVNEADVPEVDGQLVDDARRVGRLCREPLQIGTAELGYRRSALLSRGRALGVRRKDPVEELARPVDLRMRSEDLFGQTRARTRHADDEYRAFGVQAAWSRGRERVSIEGRESPRHPLRHFAAVVAWSAGTGQLVSPPMMPESCVPVVDVIVILAQSMVQVDGVCDRQTASQHALGSVAPRHVGRAHLAYGREADQRLWQLRVDG